MSIEQISAEIQTKQAEQKQGVLNMLKMVFDEYAKKYGEMPGIKNANDLQTFIGARADLKRIVDNMNLVSSTDLFVLAVRAMEEVKQEQSGEASEETAA